MTVEPTTEELLQDMRRACDEAVVAMARTLAQAGAPTPMILDRMLTYAAAQAVSIDGVENTATVFRQLADTIESGMFDRFEKPQGAAH